MRSLRQLIRRTLKTHAWLPAGRLARITLYFAALDLLFFLISRLAALLHFSFAATLAGWISFLTWVSATLAALLLLGWIRRKLLWRLRNRLIVTYTFIGVIPVVLLVAIGVISV